MNRRAPLWMLLSVVAAPIVFSIVMTGRWTANRAIEGDPLWWMPLLRFGLFSVACCVAWVAPAILISLLAYRFAPSIRQWPLASIIGPSLIAAILFFATPSQVGTALGAPKTTWFVLFPIVAIVWPLLAVPWLRPWPRSA